MEHQQGEMDGLLRRWMSGPVPSLPADFERRLMRKVRRGPEGLDSRGRILLIGYGVASVLTSAAIMRGQGMGWGTIAATTLAPLGVVALARAVRKRLADS